MVRPNKMTMLRKTVELVGAHKLWRRLPEARRAEIVGQFVKNPEKAAAICGSPELPKFDAALGRNWGDFVKAVLHTKGDKPLILTNEEVTAAHNQMRSSPWDLTPKMVQGAFLHHGKDLNVRHVPVSKVEVLIEEEK